jgi:hypothetical protein
VVVVITTITPQHHSLPNNFPVDLRDGTRVPFDTKLLAQLWVSFGMFHLVAPVIRPGPRRCNGSAHGC